MKMLKLGIVEVPFGIKWNSNRVKKMVGDFPSTIDLTPVKKWFPRVDEWPQGTVEVPLAIVWFPDDVLGGFDTVGQKLVREGIGELRLTVLPHLAAAVFPQCDDLWQKCQAGNCPRWIHATHPASFWRDNYGHRCVPDIDLRPASRGLSACRVRRVFDGLDGFLVVDEP